MFRAYSLLAVAIVSEVLATSALKASRGFSRPALGLAVVLGYGIAFYCLSQGLQAGLSVGVAYAVWSGLGIVLIATIGAIAFREPVDLAALIGFTLIVAGVVVLNVCSNAIRSP